jgi:hypothetical protein
MKKLIVPKKIEVWYEGSYNEDFNTAIEMALSYSDLRMVGAKGNPNGVTLMFKLEKDSKLKNPPHTPNLKF